LVSVLFLCRKSRSLTDRASVGLLLGAQVNSVTIDPDRGAISGMMRGVPVLTLGAGYVGSAAFGAALIFCAFDTRASKIACLATIPLWAPVAWFGTTWCVRAWSLDEGS
jgi:hypothetical protein